MDANEDEIDLRSKLPADFASFLSAFVSRLKDAAMRPPIIPTPIRIVPPWLAEIYEDEPGLLWGHLSVIDATDSDTED